MMLDSGATPNTLEKFQAISLEINRKIVVKYVQRGQLMMRKKKFMQRNKISSKDNSKQMFDKEY